MDELIAQVKSLPPLKQKLVSGVIGFIVADAAAQPLHWVYSDDAMSQATGSKDPEFVSPPGNPYYHLPTGSQSMYGDQVVALMRSIVKVKGLDITDYADTFFKTFGPGSPYDIPHNATPIKGPWSNRSMIRFGELHPKGQTAKDIDDEWEDPDCIARSLPILLRYYGTADLESKLEEGFYMLQSSDISHTTMIVFAKLVDIFMTTDGDISAEDNVKKLSEKLKKSSDIDEKSFSNLINQVLRVKSLSTAEITTKFGKACPLPNSFQSSLGGLIHESGYKETVRKVILAGGCSCSRLSTVASCLGIKYGIDAIPKEWMSKVTCIEEVLSLAIQVAQL